MWLGTNALLWFFSGCTPAPIPTRIDLAGLPSPVLNTSPIDLKPVLYDQSGQVLATVFSFAVTPAGADLLSPGIFSCRKAGDYLISVSGGSELGTPITVTQQAMCRPLGKLVVPEKILMKRTDSAQLVDIKVLDPGGQAMAGMGVSALSSDPGVVAVSQQGERLVFSPMGAGKATVSYTVGGITEKTVVEVTDRPVEATFSLSPGQESSWSLPPGLYAITVQASGRVRVRVAGALGAGCDGGESSEVWSLRCVLDAASVVSVSYAPMMLFFEGMPASGGITVERLPSQN